MSKPQVRMPGSARIGIAILIVGAIFVGIGSYRDYGPLSLYGLIMVGCGFILYMASSFAARRSSKRTS